MAKRHKVYSSLSAGKLELAGGKEREYRYRLDGRWLESTVVNKAADKLPEARGGRPPQ